MFNTIKKRLDFVASLIPKNLKIETKASSSLYTYENFSDILQSKLLSNKEFHNYCSKYRDYADDNNNKFLDRAYLKNLSNGKFVCTMRELHDSKQKSQKAEVQNIISSTEAHANEFNLMPFMLTLTLSSEELKDHNTNVCFLEHCQIIYDQVSILRGFTKAIYSDRLTKSGMPNFFWMRMLEFTKKGNAHLHEALYIEKANLIKVIKLIGRRLMDFPKIGRTHLTVDYKSMSGILDNFEYKKIGKNEYLLLDYASSDFFEKGSSGAGKGLIIRVLTKRKKDKKQTKSSVLRYIMKYLLKTRNNEFTKETMQRAVFGFLRIIPFTFKRNVLFSLVKFRAIKSKMIEEKVLDKNDKHSLYTLGKAKREQNLRVNNKYEFSSFKSYVWKTKSWSFKELPTELLSYDFTEYNRHLVLCKSHNQNYWKEFFTMKVIEIEYCKKVFQINIDKKYEVNIT